jgi:acyl-CoA synthetase (AMP-forming)/AMP-acid ligase II
MTMPANLSLTIQRNARVHGSKVGSILGNRRKTWGELADRIARLAGGFQALGLQPEDRIAIMALNSDRYLEYFYATSWAGLVFVPINTRLAPPEVVHWLGDSGCKAIIVDDTFAKMIPAVKPHLPDLGHVIHAGDGEAPEGMLSFEALATADPAPASDRCGEDLAGLFYTGGTTGPSKGVMLSHANLIHNAMVVASHFPPASDRIQMHAAPMFHLADGAATFSISMTGNTHTYVPAFTPLDTLACISETRVTNVMLVPVMMNMMVNHPEIENYDLSSVRTVSYGASPMPQAVLERALEVMPDATFFQGYGQTELSPMLTVLPPERHVFEGPLAGKAGSVGQPCIGMDVAILDETGQEVPRGTVGEICARGPNVMMGYWNRPELTDEVWKFGWHHTGDAGYMDEDGFVFIVDRMKDMIISGGENVYSAEVENALYSHPHVVECAVIGIPDELWGEAVHAVVRLREGSPEDPEALVSHCRDLIANFKVPRSISFVEDALPLSGAGKILKSELRKPFWEGRAKQVN